MTHGAVLLDFENQLFLYFGEDIPPAWVDKWRVGGKVQLFCQAEIFPVIVAKRTWMKQLRHRACLWFIDNSSAQAALIRSFSPIAENYELLVSNARLDV